MVNAYRCGTERSKGSLQPRIQVHQRKGPGTKQVCIIISDDEPDEQIGKMGDDWSMDLWDDLVKNKHEHWDIRDAVRLWKRESQEGPSCNKKGQQREESPTLEKWDHRIPMLHRKALCKTST